MITSPGKQTRPEEVAAMGGENLELIGKGATQWVSVGPQTSAAERTLAFPTDVSPRKSSPDPEKLLPELTQRGGLHSSKDGLWGKLGSPAQISSWEWRRITPATGSAAGNGLSSSGPFRDWLGWGDSSNQGYIDWCKYKSLDLSPGNGEISEGLSHLRISTLDRLRLPSRLHHSLTALSTQSCFTSFLSFHADFHLSLVFWGT